MRKNVAPRAEQRHEAAAPKYSAERSHFMHITSSSGVCAGALATLMVFVTAGACTSRPDRPVVEATTGGSSTGMAGSTGNPTNANGGNGTGGSGTGGNNGSAGSG